MPIKQITPDEAAKLMEQGWKFIDVRSVPEFEEGHPSGAYNLPIVHRTPRGRAPNNDFIAVAGKCFAKDDKLIMSCRSSGRSMRAAQMLQAQGYTNVVQMRGGYAGETDKTGAVTCAGWQSQGLPVSTQAEPGRSYADLEKQR